MVDSFELLQEVDIVEYIGQYIDLHEKGGEYWGLSPFKAERTPSFSVRSGNGSQAGMFYDFSSGFSGNIVSFITRYHGVSVPEAFKMLEAFAGITDTGEPRDVTRLNASKIAKKFKLGLRQNPIQRCKPLAKDYMTRYEFRPDKLQIWADEGISWDVMEYFQVRYDSFSDRIVYPLRDYNGNIISVRGRTCDPDFKAKGIRKYTYFMQVGSADVLYGYAENAESIREQKEIILFEGEKSVMLAKTWGISNTSALLTSHLDVFQMKFLAKLGIKVTFALDQDIDPTKDENIKRLSHYVPISFVLDERRVLSEKMAPVDMGKETWEKLYSERQMYRRRN